MPPKPEDSRLISAVIAGDVPLVAALLDHGANPNARSALSKSRKRDRSVAPPPTALIRAADKGQAALVALLLDHHADINARGYDRDANIDGNALIVAIRRHHADIARLLLDCGAKTDGGDRDGRTALMWAARNGDRDIVALLLDHRARMEARDGVGDNALLWTVDEEEDRSEVIKLLLNHGADVDAKNSDGRTALMTAASSGRLDLVNLLLAHGADPNARSNNAITPLNRAAISGRLEVVRRLLAAGAEIKHNGSTNVDALMGTFFPFFGNQPDQRTEIARLLLDHGADVNCRDESGQTPLHTAVISAGPDAVRLLLARGAFVNARARDGETPLIAAGFLPKRETLQLLLDHGADINAADKQGQTPLLAAVHDVLIGEKERPQILRLLLDRGANVNARNRLGQTALMWVARYGTPELVRLLLEHGADVNARDRDGWTVLKWAAVDANADIAQVLLANGADVNSRDAVGRTPLMDAAGGREPVEAPAIDAGMAAVQRLLDRGANVNAVDRQGRTALMQAAESGTIKTVRLLLSRGAPVNMRDRDGWTALAYAAGRTEVTALLRAAGATEPVATPAVPTAQTTFYSIKQIGSQIHLMGYAPGKSAAFVRTSDVLLVDLEQEPVAGGTLEDALMSPHGIWMALAINHSTANDPRAAGDIPRSLLVVRIADLHIVYRMQDHGEWYYPDQLRWRDDNRLAFVRAVRTAEASADTSHVAFSISGPTWTGMERRLPERSDADTSDNPLVDETEAARRLWGERRLRAHGLMSTGSEGAEGVFVLDGRLGVVATDGKTVATEARFESHHSPTISLHLIVSRAREGWKIRELPLPVRARFAVRYWLWHNWLIVRSELFGPPHYLGATPVAGTARLDIICLDDPARTCKIAADLFVPGNGATPGVTPR